MSSYSGRESDKNSRQVKDNDEGSENNDCLVGEEIWGNICLYPGSSYTNRESDRESRQFIGKEEGSKNNDCPGVAEEIFKE